MKKTVLQLARLIINDRNPIPYILSLLCWATNEYISAWISLGTLISIVLLNSFLWTTTFNNKTCEEFADQLKTMKNGFSTKISTINGKCINQHKAICDEIINQNKIIRDDLFKMIMSIHEEIREINEKTQGKLKKLKSLIKDVSKNVTDLSKGILVIETE